MPCQAKVSNLEVAAGVEQQVAWFQISVQHPSGVDELEAPQHLHIRQGLSLMQHSSLHLSSMRSISIFRVCNRTLACQ